MKITPKAVEGKWSLRIAFAHKDIATRAETVWLGTAETELKADADDASLHFASFVINKLVNPDIKVSSVGGGITFGTPKAEISSPTSITIPTALNETTNVIKKTKVIGLSGNDGDALLEFKIDLSKDSLMSTLAKSVTSGLLYFSRDAKLVVGTDGHDFFLIGQRDQPIVDVSLQSMKGGWEAMGYSIYPYYKTIYPLDAPIEITINAPSSDSQTSFSGKNEEGVNFTGTFFMPDRTTGACVFDLTEKGKQKPGAFLISPDGQYVYGALFDNPFQFIGSKK